MRLELFKTDHGRKTQMLERLYRILISVTDETSPPGSDDTGEGHPSGEDPEI